jgi:hypothetical protein
VTRVQLTDEEGEFIGLYLTIGEYGPYPERLRQQSEGVSLKIPPATAFWMCDDSRVIVETWHSGLWIEDEAGVNTCLRTWNTLQESAVFGAERTGSSLPHAAPSTQRRLRAAEPERLAHGAAPSST